MIGNEDIKIFNKKWEPYLIEGFQGLDIDNKLVIKYLDCQFENEIKFNPNFQYKQIKIKCGSCRIYASSSNVEKWKTKIDEIIIPMSI